VISCGAAPDSDSDPQVLRRNFRDLDDGREVDIAGDTVSETRKMPGYPVGNSNRSAVLSRIAANSLPQPSTRSAASAVTQG
jgi:hypothetical protein